MFQNLELQWIFISSFKNKQILLYWLFFIGSSHFPYSWKYLDESSLHSLNLFCHDVWLTAHPVSFLAKNFYFTWSWCTFSFIYSNLTCIYFVPIFLYHLIFLCKFFEHIVWFSTCLSCENFHTVAAIYFIHFQFRRISNLVIFCENVSDLYSYCCSYCLPKQSIFPLLKWLILLKMTVYFK